MFEVRGTPRYDGNAPVGELLPSIRPRRTVTLDERQSDRLSSVQLVSDSDNTSQ